MPHYAVHFCPMFFNARDADEAADLAAQDCGNCEIELVERDDIDEDDDS